MADPKSVDEVVAAIEDMNQEDRQDLLLRLAKIDDLLDDLEDVADLVRSAQERGRPFDDFLAELKAEGRDL